jgi:glycosyltransferase involved in cell wall biosynthesis
MASGNPRQRVALIVTVLDEASSVDSLLESMARQTQRPDEVVIVDGGSTDGTWELLQSWTTRLPLRCVRAPRAGIARGRNLAIEASTCELIAVTDAGVRLEADWLEELVSALRADVDVVSGFFRADPCTTFEKAMGATVLPALEDVEGDTFLPSSRSVLVRRSAWAHVGGYPEWLDYCEDLVFDLDLKRTGHQFAFAPRAIAWFRPRGSLAAFFRQYYLYARGDGKANLWLGRHSIRYVTYLAVAAILAGPRRRLLLLAFGGLLVSRRPYERLRPFLSGLSPVQTACAVSLVPLIRLVGDVAKMLGYPVGVWWRLRGRGDRHLTADPCD